MKKLFAKVKRIRATRWCKLTRGEKVAKVVMSLVKYAAIVAVVVTVVGVIASVIAAIVLGVAIAFAITSAISGGFAAAGNAYIPGERYVRFK